MHLFAIYYIFSWIYSYSQCASVHIILGWKYGMEPRTSVPLAGFIIIEDQQELIFLFSDYWAALSREGSQASRKNICLSKAKPVSITALSSTFWTPTHFYQRFTLFNLYIISLTRYAPKSPLSVTPFYLFIKEWKVCEGVKHPPYVYSREKLAPSQTSQVTLHNWRFMSQKARRTRHFARVCLAWLIRRLLCRLNLYVGGLCGHG